MYRDQFDAVLLSGAVGAACTHIRGLAARRVLWQVASPEVSRPEELRATRAMQVARAIRRYVFRRRAI